MTSTPNLLQTAENTVTSSSINLFLICLQWILQHHLYPIHIFNICICTVTSKT